VIFIISYHMPHHAMPSPRAWSHHMNCAIEST